MPEADQLSSTDCVPGNMSPPREVVDCHWAVLRSAASVLADGAGRFALVPAGGDGHGDGCGQGAAAGSARLLSP